MGKYSLNNLMGLSILTIIQCALKESLTNQKRTDNTFGFVTLEPYKETRR